MLLKTEASQMKSGSDGTIADIVAMEIGNIGENMQLRRTLFFRATDDFLLGTYMYSSGNLYDEENRIGDVMVCVLISSVVDRGFEPRTSQAKEYKIGI